MSDILLIILYLTVMFVAFGVILGTIYDYSGMKRLRLGMKRGLAWIGRAVPFLMLMGCVIWGVVLQFEMDDDFQREAGYFKATEIGFLVVATLVFGILVFGDDIPGASKRKWLHWGLIIGIVGLFLLSYGPVAYFFVDTLSYPIGIDYELRDEYRAGLCEVENCSSSSPRCDVTCVTPTPSPETNR